MVLLNMLSELLHALAYGLGWGFAYSALLTLSFLGFVSLLTAILFPSTLGLVLSDLRAIRDRDPAAEGWVACAFYPGFWALTLHRMIAHSLYKIGLRTFARLVNFLARFLTGADIHPGAQLGRSIFIDHAHGVVIGETAIVGDNVTILHQVTLGGTGKDCGKRHPTIEEGVLLSAGSKILGNIVIGRDSKVGAGSVVVKTVPAGSTVVGVPGRVVATGGKKLPSQSLDQTSLPDPVVDKILELQTELREWEKKVDAEREHHEKFGQRDVLAEIVTYKHAEVRKAQAVLPLEQLRASTGLRGEPRSFYNALKGPGLALIAEIKKASPSGGLLREDFNPTEIAKIYEGNYAAALSILTDAPSFQGRLEYLAEARAASKLPILRKDFTIHEYQIVEAARSGADAVLLIAACLDDAQLQGFREAAEAEKLDALVEVHDEAELERALKSGVKILGINNRNLKTLKTSLETTYRLLEKIPKSEREKLVVVSESGISKPDDILALTQAGLNAVLIGETFMRSPDIGAKVREIMGTGAWEI